MEKTLKFHSKIGKSKRKGREGAVTAGTAKINTRKVSEEEKEKETKQVEVSDP